MSFLADEQARVAFPEHQRVNGDAIVRLSAAGSDLATIVGVWSEYSEDQLSSQRPQRDLHEGERIIRHGLLLVDREQTVTDTDQWRILGEVWQVQRIGSINGGYREIYLEFNAKKRTSHPSKDRII